MKNLTQSISKYYKALDQFHLTVFSAFLKRDYFSSQAAYEKKRAKKVQLLFKIMQKIRIQAGECNPIIPHLEHLVELFFSVDLLKDRLRDHATFEVCEYELKKISHSISLAFCDNQDGLALFQESIQSFEVIFQATLQFITADPMYFLFFIYDLRSLQEELNYLSSFRHEIIA